MVLILLVSGVGADGEGEGVFVVGGVVGFGDGDPVVGVDDGEEGVAVGCGVDVGDVEGVGERKEGVVDLAAADDEDAGLVLDEVEGFFDGVDDFDALYAGGRVVVFAPCHDDVAPFGERGGEGFEGGAPHDDGVVEGDLLEAAEVGGEVPGEFALVGDDAVVGDRGDHGDVGGDVGA